jgi:DNA polymerase-3 subunit delta
VAAKVQPGPFRVFFGDEDLLLDQALDGYRTRTNRDVVVLDGEGLEGHDVVSACETMTMSGKPRIVIVDNAQKIRAAEPLVKYVEDKDPEDRSVLLIVALRGKKLSASWFKALEKKGRKEEFLKPKPWKAGEKVQRIEEQAELAGVKLGPGVPEMLMSCLGYDLYLISNELRKLAHLVDGGEVTKKHVAALTSRVFPAEPYEVADAAAAKDLKKAMNLLGFVYRNLGDEATIPVVYAMMRLVERLIVVRHRLDLGNDPNDIAKGLGMHEYAFKMNLQPLALKHSVARLKTQMQTLCRLDALVKGPARSKRTEVELAVLSLAT